MFSEIKILFYKNIIMMILNDKIHVYSSLPFVTWQQLNKQHVYVQLGC